MKKMICINCGTRYYGSLSIWLHGFFSNVRRFFSTVFWESNHPKFWIQYPFKRFLYLGYYLKFKTDATVLRKMGIDISPKEWVSQIENRDDFYL
jgi:hypothetical protein